MYLSKIKNVREFRFHVPVRWDSRASDQYLSYKSRDITVDSQLSVPTSLATDDDVTKTGFLQYSATVVDTKIGRDQFTEVIIKPLHKLSNIYVT